MACRALLGDGLDIYPTLPEAEYSLIVSDGAYGIGGFPGDPISKRDLAAWYEPHLAAWDRLRAPSSSLYFWGMPEGCARMLPVIEAHGWMLRNQIRWDKGPVRGMGSDLMRSFPVASEDCYFYQREELAPLGGPAQFIAYAAGASEKNTIRAWLNEERARAEMTGPALEAAVNRAGGKGIMTVRHSFAESQWAFPTWDQWKALHTAWNAEGRTDGRPYLQRDRSRVYDLSNAADHDALRADYDALRADYDALRAPFTLPVGVTDTWTGLPHRGTDRHSCAKNEEHVERIVLASSRPGDLVLEPFGGGASVLRACRRLGRRCDSIERDPEWHARALASLRTAPESTATVKQPSLFG